MQEKNPHHFDINPDRITREVSAIHKVIFPIGSDSYAISVTTKTEDGSENSQEKYRFISLAVIQDYKEVELFELDERREPTGQLPELSKDQEILLTNIKQRWNDLFVAIEKDDREEVVLLLKRK